MRRCIVVFRATTNLLLNLLILLVLTGAPALAAGRPLVQVGLASFYGPEFHGKTTATGGRFDMQGLTAAHPSYPGGTVLKVTNLENARAVRVRVTDRGPARPVRREGVIIDLSRAAARRLRFTDDGRARVRVEVVKLPRKKK
jgi:rare lipoprotein A